MHRLIFAAAACASLAACLAAPVPSDPNFVETDVQSDGVTVVGSYDPSGFSSDEVRKMAGFSCLAGDVASFTEAAAGTMMNFTAVCAQGTFHGAGSGVNFNRTGPKSATYSSIYSENGQIVQAQGPFLL